MRNGQRVAMSIAGALAMSGALAAQEPSDRYPIPLADVAVSIDFLPVKGEPRWFAKPVGAADRVSFSTSRVYDNAQGACSRVVRNAKKDVRNLLFEHLLPALGQEDTMALLEPLLAETVLVSAEVGLITLHDGTLHDGTLHDGTRHPDRRDIACLGWRAPVRSIVEKFDPQQQGRIEWLLIRGVVNWRPVVKAPDWTTRVPQRDGYVRCAFAHVSKRADLACALAISAASRDVHAHVTELLEPAVGKKRAAKAARAGVMRIGAVRKAFHGSSNPKGGVRMRPTAYALWEVPIAPMLLELPKGLRKVAEYQLVPRRVQSRR